MRFIYAIGFSLLITIGIMLLNIGLTFWGFLSLVVGAICWIYNAFKRRSIILYSIVTLAFLFIPANANVSVLASNVVSAVGNISIGGSSYASVQSMTPHIYGCDVILIPTTAKANTRYIVRIYENDVFVQENIIMWSQPEISVHSNRLIRFGLTEANCQPYFSASIGNKDWWKPIYTVKIVELKE